MQSVSELTEQIKSLMEATFLHVSVSGEVSRVTYHTSGHLYFTLKDSKSSISCVMFRGNNQKLKFRVEDSMMVDISGSISVYAPRGSYQINCVSLNPSGSGALALAYEQLKKELHEKGYFSQKRPLPKLPKHIALVTSKTGAALQDMLNVAKQRYPLVKITLYDTLVQGENAKYAICEAIKKAQNSKADIIVVGRGGGSVEDLWAFNEKEVALALYESKIPTVSAVGHAIDSLITDFVADLSAPTPSAAMEMILPDINQMKISIDDMMDKFSKNYAYILQNFQIKLNSLANELNILSPKAKLALISKEILTLTQALTQKQTYNLEIFSKNQQARLAEFQGAYKRLLAQKQANLEALELTFTNKNPKDGIKKGYAQIVKDDKPLELEKLKKDDIFSLLNAHEEVISKVLDIKKY